VTGSLDQWRSFSKVVSGRIVNGYCRGDWLLKFLYRTSTASIKIAGLDAIDWRDRRMINVDLSDIVSGHLDYYKKLGNVLRRVGVQVDPQFLVGSDKLAMRKCVSGMPDRAELRQFKISSIRMSISDPSFARWFYPTSHHFNTRLPDDEEDDQSAATFSSSSSSAVGDGKPTVGAGHVLRRAHSDESVLVRLSRSSARLCSTTTMPDIQSLRLVNKAKEAAKSPMTIVMEQDLRSGATSVTSSCSTSSGYGGESVGRDIETTVEPKSDLLLSQLSVAKLVMDDHDDQ
jgi:hypothetical protein